MSILLLSHQRCGSSALTRFMAKACGVTAAMEPFNKRVLSKTFPEWESASHTELAAHFDAGLRAKRVTKHIYGQHDAPIDQLLIESPAAERLVLLWREDVEAAALSSLIARATGTYQRQPEDEGPIRRIPPHRVRALAGEMRSHFERTRSQAEASGKPLRSVSYESVYQEAEEDRRRALRELLAFVE
uniref:hypothetical protein n=1 Tax=Ornithinicoccus halotolerans TaxID=1748220 RepID=UPI0012949C55